MRFCGNRYKRLLQDYPRAGLIWRSHTLPSFVSYIMLSQSMVVTLYSTLRVQAKLRLRTRKIMHLVVSSIMNCFLRETLKAV